MITFTIYGEPKPQGSKIAHAIYGRDGKPVMKNGRVVTICRESSKEHKSWRNQVAEVAIGVMQKAGLSLIEGPVELTIEFVRPRPSNHFGSGRNADKLKPSAPKFPITRPDTIKLTRAVEDALTGIVWKDDSQVVVHELIKRYGDRYETRVMIVSF